MLGLALSVVSKNVLMNLSFETTFQAWTYIGVLTTSQSCILGVLRRPLPDDSKMLTQVTKGYLSQQTVPRETRLTHFLVIWTCRVGSASP